MKVALGLTLASAILLAAVVLCRLSPGNNRDRMAGNDSINTAKSLAAIAPKIRSLCKEALFNEGTYAFPTASTEFRTLQEQLVNPMYGTQRLLPLLSSPDPKLRTLVIVALALKDDPQLLPTIAKFSDDQAPTYPCIRLAPGVSSCCEQGPIPQTVSDIATLTVASYLRAAGYDYNGSSAVKQIGFESYWTGHKDRQYSASWFAVRLLRASGEHAAERRRAVLADIARLPSPDRQWTLLWLAASNVDDYKRSSLLSDHELVHVCREIGRPALLKMLAGHIPISDPDLQPRQHNNAPYREMIEAVLRHSEGLFDRGDSGELLRDELMQSTISSSDPSITAWWSIAAARLDRRSAGKILHDALPRFSGSLWKADRARIVATLWELGNASEKGFVLNWFYREPPVICGGGSPQQIFLESAATAQGGWPRLESLLADPRFDFLDRVSLAWLVNTVNQRSNPPIISGHELMQACSSDETDQLRVTVARWRKKTRASAPTWGRPGKRWTPPAM